MACPGLGAGLDWLKAYSPRAVVLTEPGRDLGHPAHRLSRHTGPEKEVAGAFGQDPGAAGHHLKAASPVLIGPVSILDVRRAIQGQHNRIEVVRRPVATFFAKGSIGRHFKTNRAAGLLGSDPGQVDGQMQHLFRVKWLPAKIVNLGIALAGLAHQAHVPIHRVTGQLQVHDLTGFIRCQEATIAAGKVAAPRGQQTQEHRRQVSLPGQWRRLGLCLENVHYFAQVPFADIPSRKKVRLQPQHRPAVYQGSQVVERCIDKKLIQYWDDEKTVPDGGPIRKSIHADNPALLLSRRHRISAKSKQRRLTPGVERQATAGA